MHIRGSTYGMTCISFDLNSVYGRRFLVSCFFFFKQKTAYEMRISDWSSDVCSSDLSCRASRNASKLLRCSCRKRVVANSSVEEPGPPSTSYDDNILWAFGLPASSWFQNGGVAKWAVTSVPPLMMAAVASG